MHPELHRQKKETKIRLKMNEKRNEAMKKLKIVEITKYWLTRGNHNNIERKNERVWERVRDNDYEWEREWESECVCVCVRERERERERERKKECKVMTLRKQNLKMFFFQSRFFEKNFQMMLQNTTIDEKRRSRRVTSSQPRCRRRTWRRRWRRRRHFQFYHELSRRINWWQLYFSRTDILKFRCPEKSILEMSDWGFNVISSYITSLENFTQKKWALWNYQIVSG